MVYKLRPLELALDFEDRTYQLGDTINVTVELVPNADVDVREVRVDLIREERYVSTTASTFILDIHAAAARPGGGGLTEIRGHMTKENRETYVHSSAAFLSNTRVQACRTLSNAFVPQGSR